MTFLTYDPKSGERRCQCGAKAIYILDSWSCKDCHLVRFTQSPIITIKVSNEPRTAPIVSSSYTEYYVEARFVTTHMISMGNKKANARGWKRVVDRPHLWLSRSKKGLLNPVTVLVNDCDVRSSPGLVAVKEGAVVEVYPA